MPKRVRNFNDKQQRVFANYDRKARWCRATQHIWQHPGMSLQRGGSLNGAMTYDHDTDTFVITLTCVNCDGERVDKVRAYDGSVKRFYRYREGYSLHESRFGTRLPSKQEWRREHYSLLAAEYAKELGISRSALRRRSK